MTRPRNRPVGGRYWVVVDASGSARDCHTDKRTAIGLTLPTERLVECVAMPRVTVRYVGNAYGEEQHEVSINGLVIVTGPKDHADKTARDLRRALRGK